MNFRTSRFLLAAAFVTGAALVAFHGCTKPTDATTPAVDAPAPAVPAGPLPDQTTFASAADASNALIAAVKDKNRDEVHAIFGSSVKEFISGDAVQDVNDFASFYKATTDATRLEMVGDDRAILHVGTADWPFPVPIVRAASGKWYYDTVAGMEEVLDRRIGENELFTIKVCRAYVVAQGEYAQKERDGDPLKQFAQHLASTPGKHDGLYWPAAEGEEESPFGPLAAEARLEGYKKNTSDEPQPFHGYYYRILTAQGPHAPGEAFNYIINGRMLAGFALIVCPSNYGNSGVMTFIVNHQGLVYQKDLGENSIEEAKKITAYDPDSTWTLVKD